VRPGTARFLRQAQAWGDLLQSARPSAVAAAFLDGQSSPVRWARIVERVNAPPRAGSSGLWFAPMCDLWSMSARVLEVYLDLGGFEAGAEPRAVLRRGRGVANFRSRETGGLPACHAREG
jgi:hypothetical protein